MIFVGVERVAGDATPTSVSFAFFCVIGSAASITSSADCLVWLVVVFVVATVTILESFAEEEAEEEEKEEKEEKEEVSLYKTYLSIFFFFFFFDDVDPGGSDDDGRNEDNGGSTTFEGEGLFDDGVKEAVAGVAVDGSVFLLLSFLRLVFVFVLVEVVFDAG